jgi:hypothetical protein
VMANIIAPTARSKRRAASSRASGTHSGRPVRAREARGVRRPAVRRRGSCPWSPG